MKQVGFIPNLQKVDGGQKESLLEPTYTDLDSKYALGFELISVVPVYHNYNIIFENSITPDLLRNDTSTSKRGDLTDTNKRHHC